MMINSGDDLEAAALRVLNVDGRISAARELRAANDERVRVAALLKEAERAYAMAHAAALREGWSEDELGKLGFTTPTVRAKGRPRGKSARTPSPARPSGQVSPMSAASDDREEAAAPAENAAPSFDAV
ncbi:hypothetical protein [Actinomadura kijaniata]|uniref:hypothetical protein n=1 Tax=Actinomadura kijaniata TaxID=46161 RepID=UPI00082D34A2|nr:hypothetical protein [Actinomadura kijaniata]